MTDKKISFFMVILSFLVLMVFVYTDLFTKEEVPLYRYLMVTIINIIFRNKLENDD